MRTAPTWARTSAATTAPTLSTTGRSRAIRSAVPITPGASGPTGSAITSRTTTARSPTRPRPAGKCNPCPASGGATPNAAAIRSGQVVERMGCIWAWHDPENGEPDYEVPDFAEWNDPQWVRWKIDQMGTIALHPQEVLDNMADVAHLNPVHGSTVEYFENEFRDHVVIQRQGGGHRTLVTTSGILETDTWYTGPAILYSKLTGLYDTLMLITHTPVDTGAVA